MLDTAGSRSVDPPVRWRTWSNLLTATRVALAPAFVLAPGTASRGAVLAAATATEWLDGFLARRTGMTSRVGEILDPIADRAFVLTALITFLVEGRVTAAQLLLLLSRDIFTATGAGVALSLRLPIRLRARFPGKVVTTLQLAALVTLLLRPDWIDELLLAVVPASAIAIVDYARAAVRSVRGVRR